jgi:hypothetical protein
VSRAVITDGKADAVLSHGDRRPTTVAGVERIVVHGFDITFTATGIVVRGDGLDPIAVRPVAANMVAVELVKRAP